MFSGLDIVPVPHTSAATSSAISRYGDYLEGVYSRSPVSSDGKFPPTPSKTYVNLAVVKHASHIRDIEQLRKNTLHGRVDEMIKGKTKIELTDILKTHKDGNPVSLVFIEGPPGIGKSTLAWELCRRWDRKQYDLAVLLRLREREVQKIECIADLFPHGNKHLQQLVTKEVLGREGKGVLFILDGYDELPVKLRQQGLLLKLVKGEDLPNCSVLVTSRPSATSDLLMACSPQIQRHVEILGFTQESVKDYASSIFSSETEVLKDFLTYISASENPAINSLMYIPLNAAIIVHMYRSSRRKGCPIPKTMTQVYTQLCLTLLQRYLKSNDPQDRTTLYKLSDLPSTYYDKFKQLAQLAFEQFEKQNVVFYSQDVPKELVHFGFLDSVSSLYGGGGVSYNFLHLTLQEFLAAYHITQLSSGTDVFNHYCLDRRWEVVWRFVSGLTGFQFFMSSVQNYAFSVISGTILNISYLLLHCLFEGELKFDFLKAFERDSVTVCFTDPVPEDLDSPQISPLDKYALGYCIANCSSTTSWKVEMKYGSDESFMWGLKSSHSGNGAISHLKMPDVDATCLDCYPVKILHGIKHLELGFGFEIGFGFLLDGAIIPSMNNLTSLSLLDLPLQCDNDTLLTTFSNLLHLSKLPKLKCLTIGATIRGINQPITKRLCDILVNPSTLKELTLDQCSFEDSGCLDSFATSTSLSGLFLSVIIKGPPFQALSKILRNKTIQKLRLDYVTCISETLDIEQVDNFKEALSSNTSLEQLTLFVRDKAVLAISCKYYWSLTPSDPRVRMECVHM